MMPIEQQVCNLELAKRLRELNVPQNSYFRWSTFYVPGFSKEDDSEYFLAFCLAHKKPKNKDYATFTVGEIFDWLPVCCSLTKEPTGYQCIYLDTYDWFEDANPANACAKMLIYLVENGHVKIEDL